MGYIEYPKGSKMASDPGDIATLTVSRGYDPNNDDYDVRSAVIQPLEMDQVGQLGGSAPFGGKHGRIAIENGGFMVKYDGFAMKNWGLAMKNGGLSMGNMMGAQWGRGSSPTWYRGKSFMKRSRWNPRVNTKIWLI